MIPTSCDQKRAHFHQKPIIKSIVFILILTIVPGLSGCYHRPYPAQSPADMEAAGQRAAAPSSQVYFYPKHGQTTEQQSRDHYECYLWAVRQTGFDPGQSVIPREQRLRAVPMPPAGYDAVAMAVAGAVIGALFGGPRHAAEGALIGAAGGAIAGAASDASRQEEARMREEAYAQAQDSQLAKKTSDFRRAMSACLEGRGYFVQ